MKRILFWIRRGFGFSASETNGFLILLPLMAICIFSEPVYEWWFVTYGFDSTRYAGDRQRADSVVATWKWERSVKQTIADTSVQVSLSSFDPNHAGVQELVSAGISEKIAIRIIRYRKKGGKFRVKTDISKIYGIDSLLADKLMQKILLPDSITKKVKTSTPQANFKKKKDPPPAFDLNHADTTELISIYGVGPKLSKRIIGMRERLGGFVSMAQLNEVYGLDSATVEQLRKRTFINSGFVPRQIDLNKAGKNELATLPYIRFALANAIMAWRFQHGAFKSIEELKQIVLIDAATFEKIKPYLTIKD